MFGLECAMGNTEKRRQVKAGHYIGKQSNTNIIRT